MTKRSPFRYFKTSFEIISFAVMMYVRFSLSLRNVEDLLSEQGYRSQPINGAVLVEQVRPDVRRRDPKKTGSEIRHRYKLMRYSPENVRCQSRSLRHLHLPKQMMGPYGALFSFCFKVV